MTKLKSLNRLALVAIVSIATPVRAGTFIHPTEGWSVTYPSGWDTNADSVDSVHTPFQTCSSTCRVQIVREGQAEITVRTLPPATDEYAKMTEITRDTEILATPSPLSPRRDYRWGGGKFQYAVVAVRKGGKLFFVHLAQQLPLSQAEPVYEAAYQSVLASITVTK